MKAIFLDRDGVINEERKDYVKNLEEFKIFDNVSDAISLLKKENFLVVIITNQSAINRKLLSVENLENIHKFLKKYLEKNNTSIDGIYYCPHTPDECCSCRKPKPGLLIQASLDLNIDLKNSWMIGDSKTDLDAAKAVGCKSILLNKNEKLFDIVKELISNNKSNEDGLNG